MKKSIAGPFDITTKNTKGPKLSKLEMKLQLQKNFGSVPPSNQTHLITKLN